MKIKIVLNILNVVDIIVVEIPKNIYYKNLRSRNPNLVPILIECLFNLDIIIQLTL